jgi:hypothetical protein
MPTPLFLSPAGSTRPFPFCTHARALPALGFSRRVGKPAAPSRPQGGDCRTSATTGREFQSSRVRGLPGRICLQTTSASTNRPVGKQEWPPQLALECRPAFRLSRAPGRRADLYGSCFCRPLRGQADPQYPSTGDLTVRMLTPPLGREINLTLHCARIIVGCQPYQISADGIGMR